MLRILICTLVFLLGRSKGECLLDWSEINTILGQTVDHDDFGVEPSLGLGNEQFHGTGASIDSALEALMAKNASLDKEQVRECLREHYVPAASTVADQTVSQQQPGGAPLPGLQYETPVYLGGVPAIGVPVPDDDEYRPGAEGYTTYINPHNFVSRLKPMVDNDTDDAPFDIFQSLLNVFEDLSLSSQETSLEGEESVDGDNSTELDYGLY